MDGVSSLETRLARLDAHSQPHSTIRTLTGHTHKVRCLAWSADGAWLASGSEDATLRLWRFDAGLPGRESKLLRGHAGAVTAIAWCPTPGAATLASAGTDGTVRVWDATGPGKQEQSVALPERAYSMAWKLDGSMLAIGTQRDEVLLLDVRRATIDSRKVGIVGRLGISVQLNEIAWTPSGLLFGAAGLPTGTTDDGLVLVMRPVEAASAAAASESNLPAITDTAVAPASPGTSGATAAAAPAAPALPYRIEILGQLPAHTAIAYVLRFDPTYRRFATGGEDSIIGIWSTETLVCERTVDRLETMIRSLSFSHDGEYLATGSDDRVIELVRVSDGVRVRGLPQPDRIESVAWAPNAYTLACIIDDKSSRVDAFGIKVYVF